MRIFITGIAGFIGSHLAEKLVAGGHTVSGIDNFSSYYNQKRKEKNAQLLGEKGVHVERMSIDEISSEYVKEYDFIFHLAAQPGIASHTTLDEYIENNVRATEHLLSSAVEAGVKKYIHISTSSVYGKLATGSEEKEPKPASYYGITKLAAEQLTLLSSIKGIDIAIARPFSVYGERERPEKLIYKAIKSALLNTPLTVFEGSEEHIRSYTHVDDIVRGLILMMERFDAVKGEAINLGNTETHTTGEVIRLIEEMSGKEIQKEKVSKRAGDQLETKAVIQKAQNLLGWNPEVSLEDGIAREIAWMKDEIISSPELI